MSRKVYFIKPIGFDGPIKIGCSFSPTGRRDTLERWSPFPLEIVAEIEGGFDIERRFHAKFLDSYRSREWFNVSGDLLLTIEAIKRGTFDLDTLPPPRNLPHQGRQHNGVRPSRKWTDQQKAEARRRRQLKRILTETGLVLPWPRDVALEEKFIADPHRYGITVEERKARWDSEYAERQLANARENLARVEAKYGSLKSAAA